MDNAQNVAAWVAIALNIMVLGFYAGRTENRLAALEASQVPLERVAQVEAQITELFRTREEVAAKLDQLPERISSVETSVMYLIREIEGGFRLENYPRREGFDQGIDPCVACTPVPQVPIDYLLPPVPGPLDVRLNDVRLLGSDGSTTG